MKRKKAKPIAELVPEQTPVLNCILTVLMEELRSLNFDKSTQQKIKRAYQRRILGN